MEQRIENDANKTIQSFASDTGYMSCEDNKAVFLACTGCYKMAKRKFHPAAGGPSCPTTG
jgi:hypothetical protein